MLDKTIEYKNIIMRAEWDKVLNVTPPSLPAGYSFRFFAADDLDHWARIEASVDEFESADKARDYFAQVYLPDMDNLAQRLIFALDPTGLPIATANSWYAESDLGRQATLHWVAVCPEHQGKGIGKAIVQQAMLNFQQLENNRPVWLHTQTWSHVAVRLYHSLGFNMMKTAPLANANSRSGVTIKKPEYADAITIFKTIMDADFVDRLISTAI